MPNITDLPAKERQITTAPYEHILTNTGCWMPGGDWLVYDIRPGNGAPDFSGERIERVNVATGTVETLYESRNGAFCGVVTASPTDDRVVFILGPEHPTADWSYSFQHRQGLIRRPDGSTENLDAGNFAPPFVPGALRGGSHVHVFSPDGQWVSFTYNDHVLNALDQDPNAPAHDVDQRNIGLSVPLGSVQVNRNHPRNYDGSYFSVLISRTVNAPKPGSDEIRRAFEEGWVGKDGYLKADGRRQKRAIAFLGELVVPDGKGGEQPLIELFLVDLPEQAKELTIEGDGPLGGTATRRPLPPKNVVQRRLTRTADRKYPGVQGTRHWLRSSPDGSKIAFLMKDDDGIVQIWTVSPNGGEPRQWSKVKSDVASPLSWSPDGRSIAHLADGSVCVSTETQTFRLTPRSDGADAPSSLAVVFSPDGSKIAYNREPRHENGDRYHQIFVVDVPEQLR